MAGDVTYQATTLATPPSGTIVETEDQGALIQRQVVKTGAAQNFGYGQITVASTATQIVAARTSRMDLTIANLGTVDIFIGDASVTTSTGFLLPGVKGAALTLPTQAAVYGIVASSTQAISFIETY